ncbi:MAG: hypothetical protein MUE40_07155 [Anaerolineae bacterium]|nr:hypothetical protein [Anaerolineae bacterium]
MTEAIIADDPGLEVIVSRYPVAPGDAAGYRRLVQRLHSTLTPVEPSLEFARRLEQDLLGVRQRPPGLLWRWRRLPARLQIAAGATLAGGFVLLVLRIFTGEWRRQRVPEEANIA